ncbi:hypothetical protein DL96DRAFT_102166 [Flagelloscypha sp. PMI_526]|nr:hypothetical protein DL96DRAFT_102166 [Flagelloscypha sp. PMI_526]
MTFGSSSSGSRAPLHRFQQIFSNHRRRSHRSSRRSSSVTSRDEVSPAPMTAVIAEPPSAPERIQSAQSLPSFDYASTSRLSIDHEIDTVVEEQTHSRLGGPDILSSLAPEILWQIISHLNHKDILYFRQCSKWFHRITKDSPAWVPLYQDRLHEAEVPLPCYQRTTLTAADIEKIACGYPRFIATARSWAKTEEGQKGVPLPHKIVAQIESIPEIEELGEQISSIRFIRGGRLLLVTSPSIIQLWDLGVAEPSVSCLATCRRVDTPREEKGDADGNKIKEAELVIMRIEVVDGKFLFALSLSCQPNRTPESYNSMLMYTIDAGAETPTFECVGRFSSFAPKANTYCFYGDKIVFFFRDAAENQYLGVHYWKEDITFQWRSGWPSVYDVELLEEANYVVSVTNNMNEVDVFACPRLSDYPNATRGQVYTIENNGLYFWSWESDLKALGERDFVAPIISSPMYAQGTEFPLSSRLWESVVKLKDEETLVVVDQAWKLCHSPNPDSDLPTWWAPRVTQLTRLPAEKLAVGTQDALWALSLDGNRVMWWEDVETEAILRFYVIGSETLRLGRSFGDASGVLETFPGKERKGDEKGPLNFTQYAFTPLLGRAVFVSGKNGFRVVEYC